MKEEKLKEVAIIESDNLVISITDDVLGGGDMELGKTLMKSYIYALTEVDPKPNTIIFINKGVFLATENSPVLESLKTLEDQGVEILSCGTCLNFYELKEKLMAGTVSNMYTIVEKLNKARNSIKI
ncbi:sulfurtransferase-like selenium metabolism protein YedF [Clostridium grantii]|uniref:Selenium metabolism protein YedF n=1 Tax=Clostridium grantii DSM 8605 TaxID=1121316 RepID=A0A1M5S2X2_9CLOT|nr:sulfurtransferase-like selenium metabolism protein YedF [Clostridium grantii]SHH32790.1 selenium metabolism protein YedF [Clostridium grantii DSM 8605]